MKRRDVIEAYGSRWTEPGNIVTNGPFRLKAWRHESELQLDANPGFFLGKPEIDEIKMLMIPERTTALAMYETGQLDFLDNRSIPVFDRQRVRALPGSRTIQQFNTYYYAFTTDRAPFHDARLRRAFAMAIDRQILAKILQQGVDYKVTAMNWKKGAMYQSIITPEGDKPWMDLPREGAYLRRCREAIPGVKAVCKMGRHAHYNVFISMKKMSIHGLSPSGVMMD